MHLYFFDYIQLTTFLLSLLVFIQKPVPLYLALVSIYFFLVVIFGMIIEYRVAHGHYTTDMGNAWTVLEFCFYYFIIYLNITSKKVKRIIIFLIVIYGVLGFFNYIFLQKKAGMNPINFTVGCLIVVSLCIYYFSELFRKTEAQSLQRLPAFWIISGILLNNVLFFPFNSLQFFMVTWTKENHKQYQFIFENIGIINNMILILTSVLFSIGFICRIRINKFIS
jgi:hypothetical protein